MAARSSLPPVPRIRAVPHASLLGANERAELVIVRAPGETALPRRRGGQAVDRVGQLTTLLIALARDDVAIDRHPKLFRIAEWPLSGACMD